MTTVLITFF